MSEHTDRKRIIDAVRSKERRRQLIASLALDEIDIRILTMRHIEHKPFDYIADSIGMSRSQIGRRYKHALAVFSEAAKE